MPTNSVVAAPIRFPGGPAWVLLDELSSIGSYYPKNATTATCLTSARRTVQVTFALADPPRVSRWSVHCPVLSTRFTFNGRAAEILNAADGLVLMRMRIAFSRATDYFVYRSGPGKPSLHLIPVPYSDIASVKRVGVLPGVSGGEHYFVVFPPVLQFSNKPDTEYEMLVFSSETQSWSSRVARVSKDRETTCDAVAMHDPSKAVAAGGSSLAWIDLRRGVLLCNVLDEEPVLRLLQWPVPPPRDEHEHSPLAVRDATLSNGAIRFVESILDDNGGWAVTVSKREIGSKYWYKCFKKDIASILAKESSYSELLRQVWDDEATKRGLDKVLSAPPTLSLSNDDVVCFMANLRSEDSEPLMLAVNAREGRVEAAEQSCVKGTLCPRTFFRCIGTEETNDPSGHSAENSCVAPNRNSSVQLGAFSFTVEHDKMMEDEVIPAAANALPSNNIFMGVNLRKEEKQASKEHKV
ncbi:unnamed protein product [Urochloa humidicola]